MQPVAELVRAIRSGYPPSDSSLSVPIILPSAGPGIRAGLSWTPRVDQKGATILTNVAHPTRIQIGALCADFRHGVPS